MIFISTLDVKLTFRQTGVTHHIFIVVTLTFPNGTKGIKTALKVVEILNLIVSLDVIVICRLFPIVAISIDLSAQLDCNCDQLHHLLIGAVCWNLKVPSTGVTSWHDIYVRLEIIGDSLAID